MWHIIGCILTFNHKGEITNVALLVLAIARMSTAPGKQYQEHYSSQQQSCVIPASIVRGSIWKGGVTQR